MTCTFQHRAFLLWQLFCFSIFSLSAFDMHCAISVPTEHVKSSHCHQWNRCSSFSWPWGTGTTFSSVTFPVTASHDLFYPTLIVLPHWCCNQLHFLFSKIFKAVYATANVNSYRMVQDMVILFPSCPLLFGLHHSQRTGKRKKGQGEGQPNRARVVSKHHLC